MAGPRRAGRRGTRWTVLLLGGLSAAGCREPTAPYEAVDRIDESTSLPRQLTFSTGDDRSPAWSREGDRVLYAAEGLASFLGAQCDPQHADQSVIAHLDAHADIDKRDALGLKTLDHRTLGCAGVHAQEYEIHLVQQVRICIIEKDRMRGDPLAHRFNFG